MEGKLCMSGCKVVVYEYVFRPIVPSGTVLALYGAMSQFGYMLFCRQISPDTLCRMPHNGSIWYIVYCGSVLKTEPKYQLNHLHLGLVVFLRLCILY